MGINEKYKRGIFLLFLLLSIISGTTFIQNHFKNPTIDENSLSTNAPEDSYEPNNDPFSAYDLTMYELTWLSMINGPGAQWDDDWYKIMVSPGEERLIVNLIFKHIEGDIDLELYNSTLNLIAGSYSVVDGEFIDIIVPSGQYYIKVYFGNMGNNYDLLWDDMNPAILDDAYEENDGPGSGFIISTHQGMWLSEINGLGIQGDDDWFEIFVNTGYERLVVDCIFSNASGNIDMDICNASYVMVGNSWTDQNHEQIDMIVPSSGIYYIRLHSGNGNNTYDMRWDTFVPGDDMFEENDDYWSAWWIDPNYYSSLMIVDFDEDWFQFYLNYGDQITVSIYFSNIQGNLQLELYDPFDSVSYRIGSHSNTTDSEYINFIADYSGDWRIRVYHEDKNSTVPYDLDIWRYSGDDWAEENDDFWSAWWIDPTNYGGLMIIGGDEDWFKTYLEVGDTINVRIYFDHNIGDLELELYHPGYYLVAGSYNSNPTYHEEFISLKVQDPGEWRIKVYQISGASQVYYDLEVWIDKREPQRDDAYEWNDNPDEAYYLGDDENTWLSDIHGLAVSGDDDWYKISITPGFQHLIMNLKFNNSLGNIDISVVDRLGWYIDNMSRTSVDDIDINCAVPHPGDYFVRIFGDFMMNKYDLVWDDIRTDFRPDDNYEDNDVASTAFDLTHQIDRYDDYGIWGKSLWNINNIGIQSDNDWYKIQIAPGTEFLKLRVDILYEYSAGPIGLELYDGDLTKLTSNFTMRDNEYLIHDLPSNGTYYIRIFGDNSGSPYDLKWNLQKIENNMIPGYDLFILLGAIFGVSTVLSITWKRSKKNQ
ncbi:MAG: PPC domain-containing protein [Promethearchaeota archaeon]